MKKSRDIILNDILLTFMRMSRW